MKDRSVQYPNRYRLTRVTGLDEIYDLNPVPGNVLQEGTPINVATFLKDATAALYGLTNTAVPDDVLQKIKTLIDSTVALAETKAKIASGSYVGTGTYGEDNPNSLTFGFPPLFVLIAYINPTQKDVRMYMLTAHGGMTWNGSYRANASGGTTDPSVYSEVNGNTILWYNDDSSTDQANISEATFYYVAVG